MKQKHTTVGIDVDERSLADGDGCAKIRLVRRRTNDADAAGAATRS